MNPVILDPVIPYVGPIGGGCFSSKKLVKLEGAIPPNAYGFDINLQCGPKTYPHDDIALQISARLLNGYTSISLNSSQNGIWGKEIRLSNVPIETDQKFKISVLCEVNQYKVAINDEHYCIFPQRIPCEKVSHLSIDGDVSITRISHESISNSISASTTKHSNLPPSYDTAMNSSKDVEFQNERIAHIAIFHFRYNGGSSLKATLKNGCKNFLIFLCLIAVIILFGYFIFLIAQYVSKYDTSYSTYDIPSIDFEAVNKDMEKDFKEVNDVMARQKKMDEENKKFNDIFAKTKKMEEDHKDYFDLIQKSMQDVKNDKVINAILANSKKIHHESNTFDYDFGRSPDLVEKKKKEVNEILAKLKQHKLILATNSSRLG